MGTEPAIANEFGKANPERVWLDRAVWMVGGSCLIGCLGGTAAMSSGLVVCLGYVLGLPATTLGLGRLAVHFATLLGLALLAWQFGTQASRGSDRIGRWVRNHPWLVVASFIGWWVLSWAGSAASVAFLARTNPPIFGTVMLWQTWFIVGLQFFWPGVLAWLLWRRSRLRVE